MNQQQIIPLIKEIDYGIACRIGDTIYINKNLRNDKELYTMILIHELKHSPGFGINDIKLDISNMEISQVKRNYWNFVLSHPKSWIEFFPICKYEGHLSINILISLFWVATIILIGVFIKLYG